MKIVVKTIIVIAMCILTFNCEAVSSDMLRLKQAYPNFVRAVTNKWLIWADGEIMPLQSGKGDKTLEEKITNPSLYDQVANVNYPKGVPNDPFTYSPQGDPGRIRYVPFFKKMYGDSATQVQKNLTTIYWMPKFFGSKYPLQVTRINDVDKKLQAISNDLEYYVAQHPESLKYLENPGGTFMWRLIANTDRLSMHSFGMTIDINSQYSNYWQWDLKRENKPISENAKLTYHNDIPWEIVTIFEKYGFIWGGKWYHYDTMHFEYRPELF